MSLTRHMTADPLRISPSLTVREALEQMDRASIRHLPVVQGEKLVGIVSDRDLLGAEAWRVEGSGSDTPVAEVMQTEVHCATPDEPIVSALVEMSVAGIGCLPLVEEGRLIGIVTEDDFLTLYAELAREDRRDPLFDPPVRIIARSEAITVEPQDTALEVDRLCHERGFRHLPVLEDGHLVGILSDRDLRRHGGGEVAGTTPVREMMSAPVHTTRPTAPLSEAVERMLERRISALPVWEPEAPLGILTRVDVIEHLIGTINEEA